MKQKSYRSSRKRTAPRIKRKRNLILAKTTSIGKNTWKKALIWVIPTTKR
jgi:hypothetical protein